MLTKCTLIVLDAERADEIEPIGAELRLASGASAYLVLGDHEGKGHWEGMNTWSAVFSRYSTDNRDVLNEDPQISPEDDAAIVFTSGTTGLPRCLKLTTRVLNPHFQYDFFGRERLSSTRRAIPSDSDS